MKAVLTLLGVILLCASGFLLYQGYQEHIDPRKVYGSWIEMQVVSSSRDTLMFNETGVYINNHLVTTKFDFDGSQIRFKKGRQELVYQLRGKPESPRLRKIKPKQPLQIFIKKGFEHTIEKPADQTLRAPSRMSFFTKPKDE